MNHMNRPTLLSHSLLPRRHSPWSRVRYRGTNRERMFLMGADRKAFGMLLPAFSALYEKYTLTGGLMKKKRAHTKSRALDAVSCLALVLHWMTSTTDAKYLCLIFTDLSDGGGRRGGGEEKSNEGELHLRGVGHGKG